MTPSIPIISNQDPYYRPVNIHISRLNSLVNGFAIAILILCPPLYLAERAAEWVTTKIIQGAFLPALVKLPKLKEAGINITPFTTAIQTSDGVTLKGSEKLNSGALLPPDQQKWVVSFAANAEIFSDSYNHQLSPVLKILKEKVNYLFINYRGVGESNGFPRSAEDLYRDGSAMVASLLNRGVKPENILVHGFSLGGGVAAGVTAKYHKAGKMIRCISNRSFKSITSVLSSHLKNPKPGINLIAKYLKTLKIHPLAIITLVAFTALIVFPFVSPFLLLILTKSH